MSIWNISSTDSDPAEYEVEQAERTAWFKKIQPKNNWKDPIDAWVQETDFEHCSEAAVWFTGAPLTVVGKSFAMLHVQAPGYYATIGA